MKMQVNTKSSLQVKGAYTSNQVAFLKRKTGEKTQGERDGGLVQTSFNTKMKNEKHLRSS